MTSPTRASRGRRCRPCRLAATPLLPLLFLLGIPEAAESSAGSAGRSVANANAQRYVRHVKQRKRHTASAAGDLDQALADLQRLQARLIARSGAGDNTLSTQAKELADLELMIKQIQATEAKTKFPPASHPELKLEIARLSSEIEEIDVGHLEFELPKRPVESAKLGHDGAVVRNGREVKIKLEPLAERAAIQEESRNREDRHRHLPHFRESTNTRVQEKGIDVDTEMPYGELEPFGREDTAQELTEASIRESDEMVDQLERAEVAEEKRAVFRALTRLRGAAITSFDGVARSQTGNLDGYSKVNKWRVKHPLHHLADEESDISKWAFPDNADF